MSYFQNPVYRCEVLSLSTNLASLKMLHLLLPFSINYTGLSTKIRRFTLLRSPLGNKTSKDQFERREYRMHFSIISNNPSIILAYIGVLIHHNEVKCRIKVLKEI